MFRKALPATMIATGFLIAGMSAKPVFADGGYTPATIEIPVVVEGNKNTTVTIASDDASMELLDKTKVNNEAEFSFSVTGVTPGDHVYTITQTVEKPVDGVTYDDTVYIAEAYFQDEDGTLTGTAVIYPEGADSKKDHVVFDNVLPDESSNTGTAGRDIEAYALLMGLGIMMIGSGLVFLSKDDTDADADGELSK